MTAPAPQTAQLPEDYTFDLAEVIKAHRIYLDITQRELAQRIGKDRRDYQHIENGRDKCPPGLLTKIRAVVDEFDRDVETLVDAATERGGLTLAVAEGNDWQRSIAGRAAVEALYDGVLIRIELTS